MLIAVNLSPVDPVGILLPHHPHPLPCCQHQQFFDSRVRRSARFHKHHVSLPSEGPALFRLDNPFADVFLITDQDQNDRIIAIPSRHLVVLLHPFE